MRKTKIIKLGATLVCVLLWAGCAMGQTDREEDISDSEQTETYMEETASKSPEPEQEIVPDAFFPQIAKYTRSGWGETVMYSEGYYCIYDNDSARYGFIRENGEKITSFIYEQATPFSEGLACVMSEGKWGYIGTDGETKLSFVYDAAAPFSEGLAYFCMGDEYGFMDHDGQVVIQADCDSVSSFKEGYAYFSLDGLYGYMDQTGRIVAEPVYDDADYFENGVALVRKGSKYGLVGEGGTEILAPEYDGIERIAGEETYFCAERDGLKYLFDATGAQCLSGEWEDITLREGLFCVKQDGKWGLWDLEGNRIREPQYEWLDPIPDSELVIAKYNGSYGIVDQAGTLREPFNYCWMEWDAGFTGGGIQVAYEVPSTDGSDSGSRVYGYLDTGDLSEIIPFVYDYISFFAAGRAVVEQNGKYGIIREDGTLEYPMEYDMAQVFSDGSPVLKSGDWTELLDCDGNMIHRNSYDSITESGNCYMISKDGKYGFLDKKGKVIVPMVYDRANTYSVYGAEHIYCATKGYEGDMLLIRTEEETENDLKKALLQNRITPRAKMYYEWFPVIDDIGGYAQFKKLYRSEDGEIILYSYIEPYVPFVFPLSYSGFYAIRKGRVECLIAGNECGGSARGDHICFWSDLEEGRCLPGLQYATGGFGGFAYGGSVYELSDGNVVESASFGCISQTTGNYGPEELRDQAALFYDDYDQPHTAESIAEAQSVTEYQVNDERVTHKDYEAVTNRYRYVEALGIR
ncbi:MAG: WG repeat-containing protein [Clostridium sp.]|nr:WG repeat-containing protein [Acetatifactor muris]MCM1528068.1 WG repeat-containing protein [Bacteroides sp.]MCM1564280.1 WG repeat-containing protein [Clostridium sp.]